MQMQMQMHVPLHVHVHVRNTEILSFAESYGLDGEDDLAGEDDVAGCGGLVSTAAA